MAVILVSVTACHMLHIFRPHLPDGVTVFGVGEVNALCCAVLGISAIAAF